MKKIWGALKKLWDRFRGWISRKEGNNNLQKTTANKKLFIWGGVIIIIAVIAIAFLTPSPQKRTQNISETDLKVQSFARNEVATHESPQPKAKFVALKEQRVNAHENPLYEGSHFGKKYSAPQVIENDDHSDNTIPPGNLIRVVLANKIISKTLNHPVIAIVKESYYHKMNLAIPEGSRLLGKASHDEKARRVHIIFDTIIYPDETKAPISGVALDLVDSGSAGLAGRYHAEQTKKVAGSLLSNFISGLAGGLQDKEESIFGSKQEGSLKNGILEGLSQASIDQARRYSRSLEDARGFIHVDAGYEFLVYIDKDFVFEN